MLRWVVVTAELGRLYSATPKVGLLVQCSPKDVNEKNLAGYFPMPNAGWLIGILNGLLK